jgi:hypothetical protein
MQKVDNPVVYYVPDERDQIFPGKSAFLARGTVNHPKLRNDGGCVITSPVKWVEDDGSFETYNTRYEPEAFMPKSMKV